MENSPIRVLLGISFILAVTTFFLSGIANDKDWFTAPDQSLNTSFSLWYACSKDSNVTECRNILTMNGKYNFATGVYLARAFIVVSMFSSFAVASFAVMNLIWLDKFVHVALIFPILALINTSSLCIACISFESGVRRKVLSLCTLPKNGDFTLYGNHLTGFCAWLSLAISTINVVFTFIISSNMSSYRPSSPAVYETIV